MPDFRIVIDIPDVGPGDVDGIAAEITEQLHAEVGDDFTIRVSQNVGGNFFGREHGDDAIES